MKKLFFAAAILLPLFASALNDALKIKIAGNSYYDETVVRFVAGATPQYDGSWDAWKFFSMNPNVPSAYTSIAPGQDLSINALPALTKDTTIELFVAIPAQGWYSITATEPGAFQSRVGLFLEDVSSGAFYDLRSGISYSFNMPVVAQGSAAYFRIHVILPPAVAAHDVQCHGENNGSLALSAASPVWYYALSNGSSTLVSGFLPLSGDTLGNLAPGTYFLSWQNAYSQMFQDTIQVNEPLPVAAGFTVNDTALHLPQAMLAPSNVSQNASAYLWDFGDGTPADPSVQPIHNYTQPGTYVVTLYAMNGSCFSSDSQVVTVSDIHTGILVNEENSWTLSCDGDWMRITHENDFAVTMYDLGGRVLRSENANGNAAIAVNDLPAGMYVVAIEAEGKRETRKIMLAR